MAAPLSLQQFQLIKPAVLQGWPKQNDGPSFPVNGVLDSGTGTDANPIAGNWSGPIESGVASIQRLSNKFASGNSPATYALSYWSAQQFGADQEAYAQIDTKVAAGGMGVWARVQNPGNTATAVGYSVIAAVQATTARIWRMTAGHTYTQLALLSLPSGWAVGDGIGISVSGSQIIAWYRSGPSGTFRILGSVIDSTITGPGYTGLEIDDATGRFVNFGGGQVPASTSVTDTTTIGGAVAAGVEPTVQVPVPQGGATAAGNSPSASVAVPQGGATAGGPSSAVSVSVPQGGALAGGFTPTPATSLTISGATAGGFAPTARVTATISGAIAGGNAPTSAASVDLGGSSTGGFGATVRVSLTIGGATAGGFAPSESSSVTDTTTIGGAVAGGFGPTVRVAVGAGGATAGGYGPNDGSAPVAGPPGDPNYFLLIHP